MIKLRSIAATALGSIASIAAIGCGIPLSELDAGPLNTCETSSDCAAGGVCASVSGGKACVSTQADLRGLLLEIRPPADSSFGANATYIVNVEEQGAALQGATANGQVHLFDPRLPPLASVTGTLRLNAAAPSCGATAADGSFEATATLKPVLPFIGLNAADYTSTLDPESSASNGYTFHVDVPLGVYDLYVEPKVPEGCTDAPPPIALPRQTISGNTMITIDTAPPVRLAGTLMVPASASVDGWFLEVVEPDHGAVISDVQTLAQNGSDQADIDLKFDWTSPDLEPLIRLRPPDGTALPRLHWDLSAVGLFGPDMLSLSLSDLNAAPRHVEGQVLDGDGVPVIASVQIQSAEISGDQSSTGKYKLDAETDEGGVFSADLPPGTYRVIAQPTADPTKAVGEAQMIVPAGSGCFCGQSITVPDRSVLRGSVQGPGGETMTSAYVVVTPSLPGSSRYLDQVLTLPPLQPREQSVPLQSTSFSLAVDPGGFDFSVRPAEGSNFPWLVRPRIFVPAADITPVTDLDAMSVPYPAVLEGVIRDPDGKPLPATVVRAWVPVKDPADAAKVIGVIQIGETLARSDGSYTLPLPPSISP